MQSVKLLQLTQRFSVKNTKYVLRFQSTSAPISRNLVLIDISVNDKNGIATMTMNKLPVNSLSCDLLDALKTSLDLLEKEKVKGMILASNAKTVFSAGLDVNELYKPDPKRGREFWGNFQDVFLKLYGSSFPTAAAIHGHSPAGGCLLAMSCEYRVMCPKFTIGLNETKLGIVAPWWLMEAMKQTIPLRQAEMALTLGKLFTTNEALKVGLVDEIAKDKSDALEKCEKFLLKFQKVNSAARHSTKMQLRGAFINKLAVSKEDDIDTFMNFINQEKIQKSLGLYMKVMKMRKILNTLTSPFTKILKMFR